MRRGLQLIFSLCCLAGAVRGGTAGTAGTASGLEARMESASMFRNVPARAIVPVPSDFDLPEALPEDTDAVSFLRQEVVRRGNGANDQYAAVFTFLPRRTGVAVFPSLSLDIDGNVWRTRAIQIKVAAPRREEAMRLQVIPARNRVYVGEPLRVDFIWECALPADELQQLRLEPEFFHDAGITEETPRSTAPEARQVGFPIGGRRLIAERGWTDDKGYQLGRIAFAVFLRFDEPGRFPLRAARLDVVRLLGGGKAFAPYAAYFNNALFETVDPRVVHDRLFTESEPSEVNVLALPVEGRDSSFTGLFAPCRMESSIRPNVADVGQLMELSVRVFSSAPSGFLELGDPARQPVLRHRFWVEREPRRIWRPDGAEFLARFRPLTTAVRAFPALRFQIFNPGTGKYEWRSTAAVGLVVNAKAGQHYFQRRTFDESAATLTTQPDGIWHNYEPTPMSDFANACVNGLADYFWLWLAASAGVFAVLAPVARERRRRSIDPGYRRRIEAYRSFRKLSENAPGKRAAFRALLAACHGTSETSYTVRDAVDLLSRSGVAREDIHLVRELFEAEDAARFDRGEKAAPTPPLNVVARRLFQSIGGVAIAAGMLCAPFSGARASDWDEAGAAFEKALAAEDGSPESAAFFAEAALRFEAAAHSGRRSGRAWYNAGNAWFEAGEPGRAIAAYSHASAYRPFDSKVSGSLAAARALAISRVESPPWKRWTTLPRRWLAAAVVVALYLGLTLLLLHVRYRARWSRAAAGAALSLLLLCAGLLIAGQANKGKAGVIVGSEVFARKGPGYSYDSAFVEPLHSGLSCRRKETRGDWSRVILGDGREGWVPSRQITWLDL